MQGYFAIGAIVILIVMLIARVRLLKRRGIKAVRFGALDKSDYALPPVFVLFIYFILAEVFDWPRVSGVFFFESGFFRWVGVALCAAGLTLFLFSLLSFGTSFRIGIDNQKPDRLITTGVFAYSRNPIYTAFAALLLGIFLIFPNYIFFCYFVGAAVLFHRQVLREETFLLSCYGEEYAAYCKKVRRYL